MSRGNGITRQEILASIKYRGALTADELSRLIQISQVAVRQHLSALEEDDQVLVTVERRGLGRPAHRYHLTPRGDELFPRGYDSLAVQLLDELRKWQGAEAVRNLIARQSERAFQDLPPLDDETSLPDRLQQIAQIQSELGSMAEVLDDGSGILRLVKHNCPVRAVAQCYPQLCCEGQIELLLRLLGPVEVEQESCILNGDHVCSFRIRACHEH